MPDSAPASRSPQTGNPASLTPRELQILRLIASGHTNNEIAEQLYLSLNSVKTYIRSAYRRIGATRRSHAVIWGIAQGLHLPEASVPDPGQDSACA